MYNLELNQKKRENHNIIVIQKTEENGSESSASRQWANNIARRLVSNFQGQYF